MAGFRNRRANLVGGGTELRFGVGVGADVDTDIAIAGLKKKDVLVAVLDSTFADRTLTTRITSDGNLQGSDDTTGHTVMVWWWSYP